MSATETPVSSNFIRTIINEDLASGKREQGYHPLPSRAERLSAYRACQKYLPEFWSCQRI